MHLVDNKFKYPKLKKICHSSPETESFVKNKTTIEWIFARILYWTWNWVQCKTISFHLRYFHHATSLGGVESLIERQVLSYSTVSTTLLRISVGVEYIYDLIADLDQRLKSA